MATFMEMLNQGLGGLNTPLGQLGTQLMLASGPQQGNPSGGNRLGQAFIGMQEQQAQQQQMQMQNQLRQVQQQEMAMRARALDRQDRQDQTLQTVLQSPEAIAGMSPMQRQLMLGGIDPSQIAKISPQAKQATPPGMVDMPQADGTYIRKVWNANKGAYDESVPFVPPQAQTAAVNVDKWNTEKPFVPKEQARQDAALATQQQNAQTTQDRLAMDQAKQQRESDKATLEGKFKRLEFKQAYRGAAAQFDEALQLADKITNSKALPNLYGPNGYIPPIAGTAAADLQSDIDRLKAIGGLTELQKLKQNGIVLTPVSNTDLSTAQTAAFNYSQAQSDAQARQSFAAYRDSMQRAKDEAATRYNEYDSLYDDKPSAATAPKAAVPAVGTVMDGYRYNGGDPASPQSWSKQ